VPAQHTLAAAYEAIDTRIPLINILTEGVPVLSVASLVERAKMNNVRIVGPSSIGIISPGKGKVGSIGSAGLDRAIFSPGPVGVISKSGGMTAEISRILTDAELGQSSVVGIGGDMIIGSSFLSIAQEFEKDSDTKAIVIFGEIGGIYEEQLADAMHRGDITKPVIALIAGRFSDGLLNGTVLGHAVAIVNKGNGSASSKIQILTKAGALIARTPEDIPVLLQQVLR